MEQQFIFDAYEVKKIIIDKIKPPIINLRSNDNQEALQELIDSIKAQGLINPITVTPWGDFFEVVAGWRRFQSMQFLGWNEIPCRVLRMTDRQKIMMRYDENDKRLANNPVEEACYFLDIKEQYKWTNKSLAKAVHKSEAYISERLNILKYPLNLQIALSQGAVNFSVTREIWRLKNPELIAEFGEYCIKSGCTTEIARGWVDDKLRELQPLKFVNTESQPTQSESEKQLQVFGRD